MLSVRMRLSVPCRLKLRALKSQQITHRSVYLSRNYSLLINTSEQNNKRWWLGMRSSNKGGGVLGKWTTIIVLALLLAFLVSAAPVSGAVSKKQCVTKCGILQKKQTAVTPEHQEQYLGTITLRKIKYERWLIKDRTCKSGYYYRICEPRSWCENTKYCAIGVKYESRGADYKTCSPWKAKYKLVRV